jgi:hypothetical protein
VINSYSSDAPAGGGRGGRGGRGSRGGGRGAQQGDPDDPDDAMMAGRTPGANTAVIGRVTKNAGLNRFIWDVRHQSGLSAPPGSYQARLKVGDKTLTQPLTVLVDPNVAADGITAADLKEQFDHNMRMRELVASVGRAVDRVRQAQNKLRGASGADGEKARQVDALAAKLLPEPVRYGKPGLQTHITYLAGMTTRGDQKVGRDALERYEVLKKELDAVLAETDRVLGPGL